MSHLGWHVKTGTISGPLDWSKPHDEGCPGCQIEELEQRLAQAEADRAKLRKTLRWIQAHISEGHAIREEVDAALAGVEQP